MNTAVSVSPKSFLHVLLTIFIGLLVAGFIGMGIAAFYTAPKSPTYPASLQTPVTPAGENVSSAKIEQDKFNQDQEKYQENYNRYNRNVSIAALVAALLIMALSLTLVRNVHLIADGLLLGSIFTLIYSIIRAVGSSNNKFEFLVVAVGLAVTLLLTYLKFVRPTRAD